MKKIITIVYFGYGVLVSAFGINWLGNALEMKSWYEIFGNAEFYEVTLINQIWLVVIYPLLLGFSIYLLTRIWSKLLQENL